MTKLRKRSKVVHLISKTQRRQNLGAGAKTADHWERKYVRGASVQRLDWLLVEGHAVRHGPVADIARVSLNHDVRFLLVGDFRQLRPCWTAGPARPSTSRCDTAS